MSLVVSVPTAGLARDLEPLPEGVEVLVWEMDAPAPRDRIDLVVPPYMSGTSGFTFLAGVETQLVQGESIGYEGIAAKLPPGVVFANAATVHEASTAELAVGLTLALQRHLDDFARDTAAGRWAPQYAQSLADRRVLLVGYGASASTLGATRAGRKAAIAAARGLDQAALALSSAAARG